MPTLSAFCQSSQTTGSRKTPSASASADTQALLVATLRRERAGRAPRSSSPRSRARPAAGPRPAPRWSPARPGRRRPRRRRPARRGRTPPRPTPTSAGSGTARPGRPRRRTARRHARPGPCEPVDRRAGPGHQGGQPADQRRVRRRGPDDGQVRGRPLVEPDQLVDLGAVEPARPRPARRSSCSRRSHSPRCAATYASTSTRSPPARPVTRAQTSLPARGPGAGRGGRCAT